MVGIEGFEIGDTVSDLENPEALKTIAIDEPTMSMLFTINDSPFFGKDGKYVTSRHIKDRLEKELEKNLALRMGETGSADKFMVFGRGVLHLSVLIETMRREGYELQIGQPQVIIKEIDGVKCEPFEEMTIDLPENVSGKAIEMVTMRKGDMLSMEAKGDRMVCEFLVPSRGIIGLRNQLLTATAGEAKGLAPSGLIVRRCNPKNRAVQDCCPIRPPPALAPRLPPYTCPCVRKYPLTTNELPRNLDSIQVRVGVVQSLGRSGGPDNTGLLN